MGPAFQRGNGAGTQTERPGRTLAPKPRGAYWRRSKRCRHPARGNHLPRRARHGQRLQRMPIRRRSAKSHQARSGSRRARRAGPQELFDCSAPVALASDRRHLRPAHSIASRRVQPRSHHGVGHHNAPCRRDVSRRTARDLHTFNGYVRANLAGQKIQISCCVLRRSSAGGSGGSTVAWRRSRRTVI